MISVYIAAPYQAKQQAEDLADYLEEKGVRITSRWHCDVPVNQNNMTAYEAAKHARNDIADIRDADVLVLMTNCGPSLSGGCHFEAGYALGLGKSVVVYGPAVGNIFHELGFAGEKMSHIKDSENHAGLIFAINEKAP